MPRRATSDLLLLGSLPADSTETALRAGGRTASASRDRHRMRNALVVAQVALAVAALEAILVLVGALPWWLVVALAVAAVAGYVWAGRDHGNPTVRAASWVAAVSQLIVHSGYNWSLRHLNPLFVAVVSVGEPVLASVLGWWLLGEAVDWRTGVGGLLILAGIALAVRHAPAPG